MLRGVPKWLLVPAIIVPFSLIQTAVENGLDPYRYLVWPLASAAKLDLSLPDHVRLLMPRMLLTPVMLNYSLPHATVPNGMGLSIVMGDLTLTIQNRLYLNNAEKI